MNNININVFIKINFNIFEILLKNVFIIKIYIFLFNDLIIIMKQNNISPNTN